MYLNNLLGKQYNILVFIFEGVDRFLQDLRIYNTYHGLYLYEYRNMYMNIFIYEHIKGLK
jgi:hypothetical protein